MNDYTLYGRPGWGSALIEAQLDWYGLPWRLEDSGDLLGSDDAAQAARARLALLNPLSQVPVLVLPPERGGLVMTESAAITLHLADITGRDDLVPGPNAPERAAFLRWLTYLVANIYPCFTFGDVPERYVSTPGAAEPFADALNARIRHLWTHVEGACSRPHFLGERFSALDIYLSVMTRWRPRRAWFAENTPFLAAAAGRADEHPLLAPAWARNFRPLA
jgi:GST-like protein